MEEAVGGREGGREEREGGRGGREWCMCTCEGFRLEG